MDPYAHPPSFGEVGVLLSDLGFPAPEAALHSEQGWANHTFFAGEFVVRFAKNVDEEADWRTEGLAHPYASELGLPTPPLLFHGRTSTGRAVSVVQRVRGQTIMLIGECDPDVYRQLGIALARLHASAGPRDPENVLDVHTQESLELDLIPASLRPLVEELRPYSDPSGRTFIHGDATLENLMVGDEGRLILIDWGDAGWGHPAYDFSALPISGLPAAWEGYAAAGGQVDIELRRRTVALHFRFIYHPANRLFTEQTILPDSSDLLRRLAGH